MVSRKIFAVALFSVIILSTFAVAVSAQEQTDFAKWFFALWDKMTGKAVSEDLSVQDACINDTDLDGICDEVDNCVDVSNADQTDVDGDGYGAACDCDDNDDTVYPGAPELCDGKDNNCNGDYNDDYAPLKTLIYDNTVAALNPLGAVWSSPAIVDGVVYIGSLDGNLYAVNATTNEKIWNYTVDNGWLNPEFRSPWTGDGQSYDHLIGAWSSPAVANGIVYIGSADKNIYALNATTGSFIWNYATNGSVGSSPVIVGDILYVASWDGNVYALNAEDGTYIWSTTVDTSGNWNEICTNPLIYSEEYISRYNWFKEWPRNFIVSIPAVADGKLFIGVGNNRFFALNAEDGTVEWNRTIGFTMSNTSSIPIIGTALDENGCMGDPILQPLVLGAWSSPAFLDGIVYTGSFDGNVYAMNASTGDFVWNYINGYWNWETFYNLGDQASYWMNTTTGSYIFSSPTIVDGKVYIGSFDGRFYALDAITGEKVFAPYFGAYISNTARIENETAYFNAWDLGNRGFIVTMNLTTGKIMGAFTITSDNLVVMASSPAIVDGMLYAGAGNGNLYAINTTFMEDEMSLYYFDSDGDGYGQQPLEMCGEAPAGYVINGQDCNDGDPAINPGATEICNSIDDDCNGLIDDEIASIPTTCGVGGCFSTGSSTCVGGAMVDSCVAGTPSSEVCGDGIDNNCNGQIDEGGATFYGDPDKDGFGDVNNQTQACGTAPAGYVDNSNDQCPVTYGKTYMGCPVADKTTLDLQIVDQLKSGICGLDKSGKPKPECQVPLVGTTVKVFDRENAQFVAAYGSRPKKEILDIIYRENVGLVGSCTTDATGICTAGEDHPGKFLVIAKYTDAGATAVYSGKYKNFKKKVIKAFDEEEDDDDISDLSIKSLIMEKKLHFIKIIKKDGSIEYKAGKMTIVSGSQLNVLYPEYAIWDEKDDSEFYPFIMSSADSWTTNVCMQVPVGYDIVGVYDINGNLMGTSDCMQSFVAGETKVILFKVSDIGSPEPDLKFTLGITHKGKKTQNSFSIEGVRMKTKRVTDAALLKKVKALKGKK